MRKITEQALKERARSMLVAMTEANRWVYALPRERLAAARAVLAEEKVQRVEEAAEGAVERFASEGPDEPSAQYLLFDHEDLGVALLEGDGEAAVPVMRRILDASGFVPQSRLWAQALDIGSGDATRALTILSFMVIGWDDDWTDLFLLHLASPDPVVRHDAVLALVTAAMVARETKPAHELLREAQKRETFPKLAETMAEAARALEKCAGEPLDVAQVGPSKKSTHRRGPGGAE